MKKLKRRFSQKIGRFSSTGAEAFQLPTTPSGDDAVFFSTLDVPTSSCHQEIPKKIDEKVTSSATGEHRVFPETTKRVLERCSSSPASLPVKNSELPFGCQDTYIKLEVLGEGSYATVYRGQSKRTGQTVALKEINLNIEEGTPFTAIREASLLRTLRHANVITLHDIIHTKSQLIFVFEYMVTDLGLYMEWHGNNRGIDARNAILFTFQLLRGLDFCHRRRILHRDLKPQNLLLNQHGELKLADFGLARAKSFPTNTYSNEVVTLWYRPPDVLLGSRDYTTSLDIWGVGCIFLEMLKGSPVFPGRSDPSDQLRSIFEVIGTPDLDTWPDLKYLSGYIKMKRCFQMKYVNEMKKKVPRLSEIESGEEFAQSLLQFEPSSRLTSSCAMRHQIFAFLPPEVHCLPNRLSVLSVDGVIFYKEDFEDDDVISRDLEDDDVISRDLEDDDDDDDDDGLTLEIS